MHNITSIQLSQTLKKLIKVYEGQQTDIILNSRRPSGQGVFVVGSVVVGGPASASSNAIGGGKTLEETLIDEISVSFQCCNYLNPYQFGELAPASCNFGRGCLKPLQEFTWNFLYR